MKTVNDDKVTNDKPHKKIMIAFKLSEREKDMLNQVLEVSGCNMSEFFRGYIRDKHEKKFPYNSVKMIRPIMKESNPLEEMTLEQLCEMGGGEIVKDGGVKVCRTYYVRNALSQSYEDTPMSRDMLVQKIKDKKNSE